DCPRPPLGPGARREGGRSRPHRKRTWISSPSSRRSRAAIECLPPAYFAISQGLRTLFRDILKRLPGPSEPGSVSGRCFVSLEDDIAIAGIIFDQPGPAPRLMGGNKGRAGAAKWIKHEIAPAAAVLDCIRDQRDRFDRGMRGQFLQAARPEAVHSGIIPDICPVAAGIAKAKGVQMRRRSDLENKYELVLRSIKTS